MNIEKITSVSDAEKNIKILKSHIQKLKDIDINHELIQNGLKHCLDWNEILDIDVNDILYMIIRSTDNHYIEIGCIIKLKVMKIFRHEDPVKTWKRIECIGMINELVQNDFKSWTVVNRVGYPYMINICMDNKIVRLEDPIITSNINTLRPCEFYYKV